MHAAPRAEVFHKPETGFPLTCVKVSARVSGHTVHEEGKVLMYHNILIPVAYDPGFDTRRELAAAKALQAVGGRITLLHIMDPVPFFAVNYMPEGWRDDLVDAIKADLQAKATDVPGAKIDVIEGEAARMILDWVNAQGVDCVVMASHRSDPTVFGSTASWVARHAACAVHIIR